MIRAATVRVLTVGLCAAALTASAHALERVSLANGFDVECVRHEPLDATHTRIFLTGDTNYQDYPTALIVRIEALPDPPKPVVPVVAAAAVAVVPVLDIPTLLSIAGAKHNIDADLLSAVMHAESGGRVNAVSRVGARGLMQLMPGTAKELGVEDAFRADQNINGGTSYLDSLLVRYHDDVKLALAAYNAGPAAVDKYHGVPPYRETRAYVTRIINEYNRRKVAQQKAEKLATLTAKR